MGRDLSTANSFKYANGGLGEKIIAAKKSGRVSLREIANNSHARMFCPYCVREVNFLRFFIRNFRKVYIHIYYVRFSYSEIFECDFIIFLYKFKLWCTLNISAMCTIHIWRISPVCPQPLARDAKFHARNSTNWHTSIASLYTIFIHWSRHGNIQMRTYTTLHSSLRWTKLFTRRWVVFKEHVVERASKRYECVFSESAWKISLATF